MGMLLLNRLGVYLKLARPFSFTASIVPVLLGAALASYYFDPLRWELFPLVLFAAVILHAAINVINDYSDFKKGVDKKEGFGSSRVLVEGRLRPKEALIFGIALLLVASVPAWILIAIRGLPLLALVMAGFLGGLFYTAPRFGYKYIGIGDFMVFILMGPFMVIGSCVSLTGSYTREVFYISLPIGFLVTAILSSNNLRDIKFDNLAGIRTLENTLGFKRAKILNIFWIAAAYFCALITVLTGVSGFYLLLVFLSAPVAFKNIYKILSARQDYPQDLASIDVQNAGLHLQFGLLLIIAVFLQRTIR